MLPADILTHGVRTFERHIKAAHEMASAARIDGNVIHSPEFVAELIDREAIRAGATLDVLSALCPEIARPLLAAHTTAAHTLRDIREAVLATPTQPR